MRSSLNCLSFARWKYNSPPFTYSVTKHSRSTVVKEYLWKQKIIYVNVQHVNLHECVGDVLFQFQSNQQKLFITYLRVRRNGWFVFCKTRFSVIVWVTSSFFIITSFLRIFIAYKWFVAFSLHKMTLPNVPFPKTLRNSKFSKV